MATEGEAQRARATQAAANDKYFEEVVGQSQNFEHYEKIFQEVIMDLQSYDALETFRQEYEALHNSFLKSHEGERRLIKCCQDLWADISSCVLKVKAAEELSLGDKNTVEQLGKEIQKAKSKIEQSKETEVTLKEKIKQLKMDIKELDVQLKKGPANVAGNAHELQDLEKIKSSLYKDHETQKQQLVAIQHDISHLRAQLASSQADRQAQEDKLLAIRTSITQKRQDELAKRTDCDSRERELTRVKGALTETSAEATKQQQKIEDVADGNRQLEGQLDQLRKDYGVKEAEINATISEASKDSNRAEELGARNGQLKASQLSVAQQVKEKNEELTRLKLDGSKQDKIIHSIEQRNAGCETSRAEAEADRDRILTDTQSLELSVAGLSKQLDNDRKQLEDLTRERDILNKNYLKAQGATQRLKDWLIVKESQRRNLDHQVRGYERHTQKQRELIHQLAKESQSYEEEAELSAARHGRAVEEIKSKEQDSIGKQKEIQEVEARLRQQQTMLDTVLSERNLYAKNALQLQHEIDDMTRKFKGMQTLIDSLKAEIRQKDVELMKEETKVADLIKEKGAHEIRIDSFKKITDKRERTIDAYNEELHKLNQIIVEADAEKAKQRRDHLNVLNERDILGTQLIKRNDELAQLYEQIRIQQAALRKGESQYGQRLRDVQALNSRVELLRQELVGMKQFSSRLPELKLLLNKATRELNREQCRVRMLLDDCDNPRNVHRFRRMEGTEPQTRRLFERVKRLQDELQAKTAEVSEKDRIISEKEKLYVELKAVLARQPGPEVAEQLTVYQDSMQKKTGQLRAMRESLAAFQDQAAEHKERHAELQRELREMNEAYKAQRRQAERDADRQRRINEMLGRQSDAPPNVDQEVYTGYTAPPRPQTADDEVTDAATPPQHPMDPHSGVEVEGVEVAGVEVEGVEENALAPAIDDAPPALDVVIPVDHPTAGDIHPPEEADMPPPVDEDDRPASMPAGAPADVPPDESPPNE